MKSEEPSEHPVPTNPRVSVREKVVWHGEWEGIEVRLRIVQGESDGAVETVTEMLRECADGAKHWIEHESWHEPHEQWPFISAVLVEAFIDEVGRPLWDDRAVTVRRDGKG